MRNEPPTGVDLISDADGPTVDHTGHEVVKPLLWLSRISSMPYIPGGAANQVEGLRQLLEDVDRLDGLLVASVEDDDGGVRTLRKATQQIEPTGLLDRIDRHHVALSEAARKWLETQDPYWLLGCFHRHVRFVGEMLDALRDEPTTVRRLTEVANERYQSGWSTLDQTRRRCMWFTCLGLVEYKTSQLVGLTDLGVEYCEILLPSKPDVLPELSAANTAVTIPEPPSHIASLLGKLTPETLIQRDPVLGYVPRGNGESDIVRSLELLVNASSPSISRADLLAFAERSFGMGSSSFGAALTTLTKSGLIEQSGFNIYSPTQGAQEWLESADPLDLVRVFHTRFTFVMEIIPALTEFDRAPELARAAVEFYGMPRSDVGGIRNRLQLLKAAGLIVERANWRYQSTPLGEEVASRTPLQAAADLSAPQRPETNSVSQVELNLDTERLCRELLEAGVASDTPIRLEKAVAAAFAFLGFDARHIGGAGKTDVLLTLVMPGGRPVRTIIDAKSARSGVVNENAVSFDTLIEHKKHHDADFVALIGPSFAGGRVETRAQQNKVTLIPTEELADVIRRQDQSPRSSVTFLKLVDPSPSRAGSFMLNGPNMSGGLICLGMSLGYLRRSHRMPMK